MESFASCGQLVLLLAFVFLPQVQPIEIQEVDCSSIDPNSLTSEGGLDLMQLQQPVILRRCDRADSMFAAVSAIVGTPEVLKQRYGDVTVNVYPTGPFHLQLGSSIIAIPKSGSITMRTAVDRLSKGTFAFGTQRGNPSAQLLKGARKEKSKLRTGTDSTLFDNYFSKFTTTIFSMSATGAAAPFHTHSTAWLYLASGEKEWFMAPSNYSLGKQLFWGNPSLFRRDDVIRQVRFYRFPDFPSLFLSSMTQMLGWCCLRSGSKWNQICL